MDIWETCEYLLNNFPLFKTLFFNFVIENEAICAAYPKTESNNEIILCHGLAIDRLSIERDEAAQLFLMLLSPKCVDLDKMDILKILLDCDWTRSAYGEELVQAVKEIKAFLQKDDGASLIEITKASSVRHFNIFHSFNISFLREQLRYRESPKQQKHLLAQYLFSVFPVPVFIYKQLNKIVVLNPVWMDKLRVKKEVKTMPAISAEDAKWFDKLNKNFYKDKPE